MEVRLSPTSVGPKSRKGVFQEDSRVFLVKKIRAVRSKAIFGKQHSKRVHNQGLRSERVRVRKLRSLDINLLTPRLPRVMVADRKYK